MKRIEIPKDAKFITVNEDNGKYVVEFEKAFEPKDGDVVVTSHGSICVVRNARYAYCGITDMRSLSKPFLFNSTPIRYATQEEKDRLFRRLADEGYQWDASKKRVEKIRWRAELGDEYYCIIINQEYMIHRAFEWDNPCDRGRYAMHNYFKTAEEAEAVRVKIAELIESHEP